MQKKVSTIECIVDSKNCPYLGTLLIEFDALKVVVGSHSQIFNEVIEIMKNIANLHNKSFEYDKKESEAISRLKNEIIGNNGGMAIKIPPRNDCEKLFQEFLQEAGIMTRRVAGVMQELLGVKNCQYKAIIKLYENKFGDPSNEVGLLKENKVAFEYLIALRGEVEHPTGQLKIDWLNIRDDGNITSSAFAYKSNKYIIGPYLSETADFLFFLVEFLIATGISYRIPWIKYGFNPNPKEGEFRWKPYIIK